MAFQTQKETEIGETTTIAAQWKEQDRFTAPIIEYLMKHDLGQFYYSNHEGKYNKIQEANRRIIEKANNSSLLFDFHTMVGLAEG